MRVISDKNQISEDVFDFMISYLPFPQKSIRSELGKLFSISINCITGDLALRPRNEISNRSSVRTFLTQNSNILPPLQKCLGNASCFDKLSSMFLKNVSHSMDTPNLVKITSSVRNIS